MATVKPALSSPLGGGVGEADGGGNAADAELAPSGPPGHLPQKGRRFYTAAGASKRNTWMATRTLPVTKLPPMAVSTTGVSA